MILGTSYVHLGLLVATGLALFPNYSERTVKYMSSLTVYCCSIYCSFIYITRDSTS